MWSFKLSKAASKVIVKMDANLDSVISMPEFLLLCKHHPVLLKPLLKTQAILRTHTVFARFWRLAERRRNVNFGCKSIVELRALDGYNILALSMDYLNLRRDVVPRHFVEQWRLVQKKKALSYKGDIEMPLEIRDKFNQQQQQEQPEYKQQEDNEQPQSQILMLTNGEPVPESSENNQQLVLWLSPDTSPSKKPQPQSQPKRWRQQPSLYREDLQMMSGLDDDSYIR